MVCCFRSSCHRAGRARTLRHLLRGGGDVAVRFCPVHHWLGFPFGTVTVLVIGPFVFCFHVLFVVGRKALDLFFAQINRKVVLVLCRRPDLVRRDNEFIR